MKKEITVIFIVMVCMFSKALTQEYNVNWGYGQFDTQLPNGLQVDTAYGYYTYLNNGDSLFMDAFAETRAVTIDELGNSIDVSDHLGSYYELPSWNYLQIQPYGIQINKRNQNGELLWTKYMGGASHSIPWEVLTDTSNNIFICGQYLDSLDLDPNPGSAHYIHANNAINQNGFVAKLNSNGDILYGLNIKSTENLECYDIKLDNSNNLYVVGAFEGTADFDPGIGIVNETSTGTAENLFVIKFDEDGNYLWHHVSQTSHFSRAYKCEVDDDSAVYVTGEFSDSVDFSGTGTDVRIGQGGFDAFMFKLDQNGSYQWARNYGATGLERIRAIHFNGHSLIIAGYYEGILNVDPGVSNLNVSSSAGFSTYLQSIDKQGNHQWAKEIGSGKTVIRSISSNSESELIIAGYIGSQNIYNLPGGPDTLSNQSQDVVVITADTLGNFLTANSWASSGDDWANDVVWASPQSYLVAGTFAEQLFLTPPADNLIFGEGNGYEGFVFRTSKCAEMDTLSVVTCDAYISPSGNLWETTGTYSDTVFVTGGCDTIYTVDLVINHSKDSTLIISACGEYMVPSGSATYYSSGTYTDSLTTSTGCDSVLTIDLTINNSSDTTIVVSACDEYTVPSGTIYYTSGTYIDSLVGSTGCDSVLIVDLTIHNSNDSTVNISACDEYTVESGTTYYTSGTYIDSLTNSMGCDSILTIILTITDTPDTSVAVYGDSLVAVEGGVTYQWFDCNNLNKPITGATEQHYIPEKTGNYSLVVDNNGCADTSSCHQIVISSLNDPSFAQISVYPNPSTSGYVNIDLESANKVASVKLYDPIGRLCWSEQMTEGTRIRLPQESGIYVLSVKFPDEPALTYKIVK